MFDQLITRLLDFPEVSTHPPLGLKNRLLRKIYGQAEKSSPFEEVFSSAQTGNHLNNLYGLR